MPTEIRLWLEEESLSESERKSVEPIVFQELTDEEQEIIQTAIREGEYVEQIGEESVAFSALREKIEAQVNEDAEAYLKYSDTYYRIGLVEGDYIIAET